MEYRLFEGRDHAVIYDKTRPTYPEELIKFIVDFVQEKDGPKCCDGLAIDVGCGSGQSTKLLAKHFHQVIGQDISEAQISQAKTSDPPSNVTYQANKGENLTCDDSAAILVSCAQSFHWLDRDVFFKEVDRVLRPGGCIALYGYNPLDYSLPQGCGNIFSEIYTKLLNAIPTPPLDVLIKKYEDVILPYKDFLRKDFPQEKKMKLDKFVTYIATWSIFQKYQKEHPEEPLVEDLTKRFCNALGTSLPANEVEITCTFEFFLFIGRKPNQ